MVLIATGSVIGLKTTLFHLVSSHDDKRIEIKGRTLLSIYVVITISIEGITEALFLFAVGSERYYISCNIKHQAGCGVEELPSEVKYQSREHKHTSLLDGIVSCNICKSLVEERGFVYDKRSYCRVIFQNSFKVETITDSGYIISTPDISRAICHGIIGVVSESSAIYYSSDKEYVSSISTSSTG